MSKSVALCIVQRGCPACSEFVPRLKRALRGTGVEVQVHDIRRDKRAMALAEKYRVGATPTTLFLTKRGTLVRRVGGLDDDELGRLADVCARG